MSWFLRGVQSAVFHYASCAPCTGYAEGRKRRRAANKARLLREKLQSENPDEYHHPEPTGTNPFWDEEIRMGPGPPPRRARRTNTGCSRAVTTPVTQGSVLSKGGSSLDGDHAEEMRLSDDTLDDDNWNRKRYQREDEDLWGHDGAVIPIRAATSGSSGGGSAFSLKRPGTSRSGSYYSVRAPPSSEVHAPVVSLPSPDPLENRWMLQPPPKASVMAGKERAKNRSRSGSGASSRVELSLQRQLSTRHVMHKLDRGETPELPSISPNSSYSNLVSGQRHDRSRTPQIRPPSASSSRHIKRRDTAMTRTDTMSTHNSSVESSEAMLRTDSAGAEDSHNTSLRVRQTRPALSTVVSSGSVEQDASHSPLHSHHVPNSSDENIFLTIPPPTHQPGVSRPHVAKPRTPLSSSDISSLNRLQELVSPRDLLKSRFVSAPLVEAKIRLPPEDEAEEAEWRTEREKKWRWSVGF